MQSVYANSSFHNITQFQCPMQSCLCPVLVKLRNILEEALVGCGSVGNLQTDCLTLVIPPAGQIHREVWQEIQAT